MSHVKVHYLDKINISYTKSSHFLGYIQRSPLFKVVLLKNYSNNQRLSMKSIFACIIALTMSASTLTFAASETTSIRTVGGQIISIGDSLSDMVTRLDQSPKSMNTYEVKENDVGKTVSDYVYEISGITYTLTIINNQVRKIVWSRN